MYSEHSLSDREEEDDAYFNAHMERMGENVGRSIVVLGDDALIAYVQPQDDASLLDIHSPLGLRPWQSVRHDVDGMVIAGPYRMDACTPLASTHDRARFRDESMRKAIDRASTLFVWLGEPLDADSAAYLAWASSRDDVIVVAGMPARVSVRQPVPRVLPVDERGMLHGRWPSPAPKAIIRCSTCVSNPLACPTGRQLDVSLVQKRFLTSQGIADGCEHVWAMLPFVDVIAYGEDSVEAFIRWSRLVRNMTACKDSPAERLFLATAYHLAPAALDGLQAQQVVRAWGHEYRLDFSVPEHQIYVEVNGSQHERPVQSAWDYHRRNALSALGWSEVTLSAAEVFANPRWAVGVAARVTEAIVSRTAPLGAFTYPDEVDYVAGVPLGAFTYPDEVDYVARDDDIPFDADVDDAPPDPMDDADEPSVMVARSDDRHSGPYWVDVDGREHDDVDANTVSFMRGRVLDRRSVVKPAPIAGAGTHVCVLLETVREGSDVRRCVHARDGSAAYAALTRPIEVGSVIEIVGGDSSDVAVRIPKRDERDVAAS